MTESSTEFDWAELAEECIVQQQVHRVAIYDNPHGDVVIRQERDWCDEQDPFIVIARAHAIRTAHAILEAADLGDIEFIRPCKGGYEDVPLQTDVEPRTASFSVSDRVVATGSPRLSLNKRRQLVADALRRVPNKSNRAIAAECGVSDKTVGGVRAEIGAENAHEGAEFRSEEAQLRLVAAE